MGSLFALFWLFSLIGRYKHCLTPWSCKPLQGARVILLFTTVWCWATTNTKECNGYTATPFRRNRSTAATGWTRSWFVRQVSSQEGSWSRLILYGMLGFCFFSRPLLLRILGQSRLNVPLYRRWKPMTILRMVTIICINVIIWVVYRYLCVQDGWIRLDLGFYMSSTTGSRFSTSSQSKISLEKFALSR